MFPVANSPFIKHGYLSLTGEDCAGVVHTLERMRAEGRTADPRYRTLLKVFRFVLENVKMHSPNLAPEVGARALADVTQPRLDAAVQQAVAAKAKARLAEREAALQAVGPRPLPPVGTPQQQQKILRDVFTLNGVSRRIQQADPSALRPELSPLFSKRLYAQLMVQTKALEALSHGARHLDAGLRGALRSFYDAGDPAAWKSRLNLRGMRDPCADLVEVVGARIVPAVSDVDVLRERERAVADAMNDQSLALLEAMEREAGVKPAAAPPAAPAEVRTRLAAATGRPGTSEELAAAARGLTLCELQARARNRVVGSIPAADIRERRFRSRKTVDTSRRAREKKETRRRNEERKEERKLRRAFLTAVSQHQQRFVQFHREKLRTVKRNNMGVVKFLSDRRTEAERREKALERERVRLLRNQDAEGYFKLVRDTKNQRLMNLLRQTESYMTKLGDVIRKEQGVEGVETPADDPAAAAAAAGEGGGDANMDFLESRKRYYAVAHAIKEEVTEQPRALQFGKLREYQMAGLTWLVSLYNNKLNGILADEMGLGKTVQSVSLVAHLMEKKGNYGPFLFIVPMATLRNNWDNEFERWLPSAKRIVYDGDKLARRALREGPLRAANYNVLLTTFEFAMRDRRYLSKVPWEYIIVDEAHRLKNPSCKLAQDLAYYSPTARRVALTGTPLQNELPELWALLNFLHPSIFNSCDTFEKWFASPFEKLGYRTAADAEEAMDTGMTEEEKLLVIDRLHSIVRPFMLRREKTHVEKQLLDKIERVLRCDMTPLQRAMYFGVLSGQVPLHNRLMQLRKVVNHPFLFHPFMRERTTAYKYPLDDRMLRFSAKFSLLDQILAKLRATGHRVLIFSQFTKTMDVLADYCDWRAYKYLRLDGNTGADIRKTAVDEFNSPDSEYCVFMLSTRAGGLGLNLQSADTVVLLDSDWNPQNDAQAQSRAHRIGQKNQVLSIRLITSGTVEEKVLATAFVKLDAEAMAIRAGMFHDSYDASKSREMLQTVVSKGGGGKEEGEGGGGDEEEEDDDDKRAEDEEEEETRPWVLEAEAVSSSLARSPEELELFKKMDEDLARGKPAWVPCHDEGLDLPEWVADWLLKGGRATSDSDELVDPRSDPRLVAALTTTGKAPGGDETLKRLLKEDDAYVAKKRARKAERMASQFGEEAAAAEAAASFRDEPLGRGASRSSRKRVSYAGMSDRQFDILVRGDGESEAEDEARPAKRVKTAASPAPGKAEAAAAAPAEEVGKFKIRLPKKAKAE